MEEIHKIVTESVKDKLTEEGIPASQLPEIISSLARDGHLASFITEETLENVKHFASTDSLNATYVSLDGVLSLIDSLLVSSPKQENLLDEEPLEEISFIQNMGDSPLKAAEQDTGITPKISRTNKFKRPKPAHKVVRSSSSYTDLSDYYPSDTDYNDIALHSPSTTSPPLTPNMDAEKNYAGLDGLMLAGGAAHTTNISNDTLIHTQNQIRDLEKRNAELEKRLKESERSYTQTTSQNEDYISIMEDQLKENDAKLEALVREEKDLRAKDRQTTFAINKLEHEIATYQRQAETARIQASTLQNQNADVAAEIDSLRDSLREKDREVREARGRADWYEHQAKKWENERRGYEDALQHIKAQLDEARLSERELDVQKSENVGLKETIDRLRSDLNHQLAYSGSTDDSSGQLGSVSRNLGKELARQLTETDSGAFDHRHSRHELSEGEIETVVTTRRRKVKPSGGVGVKDGGGAEARANTAANTATNTIESPPPYSSDQPLDYEYVDDVREVCSRGVQAAVEGRAMETQTDGAEGEDEEVEEEAEEEAEEQNTSDTSKHPRKSIWSKLYGRYTKRTRHRLNIVPIYSTIVFICGMVGGAWLLPSSTSSVESLRSAGVEDKAIFVAYNTFEGASSFLNSDNRLVRFIQSVVWSGVDTSQLFPA